MNRLRGYVFLLLATLLVLAPSGKAAFARTESALSSLPADAQAAISRVLGQEQAGFQWTQNEGSWQVSNEPQGLQAEVSGDGLRLQSGEQRWGMSLQQWGYGTDSTAVTASAVQSASANRIEIAHGALVEWYENGPLGLEQGFTLLSSLARVEDPRSETKGRGVGGEVLTLTFALQGDLQAALDTGRAGLSLFDSSGREVLRYGGLRATDATGRMLPAWMELRGQSLALRVDDAQAQYPVTIDPLFESARLYGTDSLAYDGLGFAVAVSGNVIVVGAPFHAVGSNANQGEAYVFVMPSTGWAGLRTQSAKLRASDGATGDLFGIAVAVAGNTIVVGADGHNLGTGEAYVYVMPSSGWQGRLYENARLVASDGGVNDFFGWAIGIKGGTIVVGARGHQVGANGSQGEAYVFTMPGTGWHGTLMEKARFVASDGASLDYFGWSIAVNGNTVVVGAPFHTLGGNNSQGTVYVFVKPLTGWSGTLTENARLVASDGGAGDWFGRSVAMSGSTVVVGAPYHTGNVTQQGEAYVFGMVAGAWAQQAILKVTSPTNNSWFGFNVAINGPTIVVGAPQQTVGTQANQGEGYVYLMPGTGWSGTLYPEAVLSSSDGATGDWFGWAVAISGNTVVVGATYHSVGGYALMGQAYVFPRPSTGWAPIRR